MLNCTHPHEAWQPVCFACHDALTPQLSHHLAVAWQCEQEDMPVTIKAPQSARIEQQQLFQGNGADL